MLRFVTAVGVAGILLGCVGCGIDTDPAVFVDPSITGPKATVVEGALGTSIQDGAFTLALHLGPRASGASSVGLGAFSIQGSDQKTTIVSPLDVASKQVFPVTVDVDSDVDVPFTFGTGTAPLDKGKLGELCASAGIVVSGVIQDSLQNGATPVFSPVFHASGCP